MLTRIYKNIKQHPVLLLLAIVWFSLLIISEQWRLTFEYGGFLFLGILGAIFANSTGAGGGVVFVPFFNQFSISSDSIIATSFAIQCCGMTAGALSWFRHYRSLNGKSFLGIINQDVADKSQASEWCILIPALTIVTPFSILGIWFAQFLLQNFTSQIQSGLSFYFGLFSIVLAIAIYASIPFMNRQANRTTMTLIDKINLPCIGFFGGIVTAWLSVGVGELVAVYLILRGFNISFAIALAVILSAFSVHAGIYYHLFVSHDIYWQILIFAGAGAIMGGLIAKHIVLWFSPVRLKLFFGTWVLIMGVAGLPFFD